jgi:hypothetical protein
MSPNFALTVYNSWYRCHKATLLRLSIKLRFDRHHRSDWMSKLASFLMLPLLYHGWSSQNPVVIGHRQLSVDGVTLYCLSGQPIYNLVTWNCNVKRDPHNFHIIFELLKVPVDLFALINPRMSFTCNRDFRNLRSKVVLHEC